jgi:RNA polymerase sigma-70 factor, ECF subfamily
VLTTVRDVMTREENWTDVADLVRRAQRGDRDAFGRLVEKFQRTVHAICLRRVSNPSEALELTQEVFLHVMRRIDQLREPERFAGWLRQVAVRMAINRMTRQVAPASVETNVLEGAGAGDSHDDPLDQLIARERAQHLWEALARIKAIDREVLVAFYIQGESLIEIADRLDAPIGTIKRRLHTARKRLKAELESGVSEADEWSEPSSSLDEDDELTEAEVATAFSW